MLGTNLRCLDNLNGIWGFDTSNSLQTTSIVELPPSPPLGSTSLQVDFDEAQPADLATAITLLTQSLSSPKKSATWTKVRELDVFDGSDTCKLQPFLVQCTLNFRNRPDAFTSNSDKVTFVLSY